MEEWTARSASLIVCGGRSRASRNPLRGTSFSWERHDKASRSESSKGYLIYSALQTSLLPSEPASPPSQQHFIPAE
jgi:hypothetical protein